MYRSVAFEHTPFTLPVFVIVDVIPVNHFSIPAVITVSDPSFFIPVLSVFVLFVALYYIWYLRKQIMYINRTGKALADARVNMINNISQEVRTPLNAIIGFSEQLHYTTLDGTQREMLFSIENAAGTLSRMQQHFQELAWSQRGELQLDTYPFSLYKIFSSITEKALVQTSARQLIFEAVYDGDKQLQVAGDGERLGRLIWILLDNAIRYTDAGSIRCQLKIDQEFAGEVKVQIRVSDTGRGIAPERQTMIFEQYLHNTVSQAGSVHGTGIGLALVKALIDLHHGEIQVESTQGKGSVFTCNISYRVLPVPQTVIITQKEVEQLTGQFMKGRYLLVADDQEMNLALMDKILTRWQCRFDKAADGAVAYELFVNNNYDMVLLDLQMPRMTGLEVVKRIREDKEPLKAHIPVLALTADTTMPGNQEFIDAGFDDYLLKPFREREIYNVIIRHLRSENALVKIAH
ncbi:hybrid sensor histidine kinase/response regulator [Chitinophaga pinensis]|uniref:histidine kinase n=1 Tax=Chitinophaga pinensis (strain ATCC 43595 / DSM 2588 / LMG 13176 / NBRC 15968 / NCIMB 11800 / UQM 2034) TaxID=485918 RepID=A0A979GCF9_CHIPD|nr:response regulator [Chitinophaga pinensis]ACU64483.1 histidine kinase [Chitinophaga pinensis DSM 2588]